MKKVLLVFLLSQILLSINLLAQNWVTGGNTLTANGTFGTKNNYSVLFKSNNSERGRLTNSGLWGFGTTSPTSKVQINSASGQVPLLAQVNGSTKFVISSGGGVSVGSSSTPPSNGLYVAGNVGIGTTIPGDKLSIKGGAISFHHTSNDVPYVGIDYDPASDAMRFRANLYSTLLNTTYLTMQRTTGNIGIGTSDPGTYKLKISSNGDGLDIENTSTLDDWELQVLGLVSGGEVHEGNLFLISNGNFRGEFDKTNGSYFSLSDERLKTNIKPMNTVLKKINKLKPSTYEFKNTTNKQEYDGFIAQDVMKIFPDLVTHNIIKDRKLDVYTMNYSGFGVLAIKGIQELMPVIEEQKERNAEQKDEITTLKDRIDKLEEIVRTFAAKIGTTTNLITNASLDQNNPNPFSNTTAISYTLPQKFTSAQIVITDKSGKTLKQVNVSGVGKGSLNIDAATLASGAYNYLLLVNGKLIATRQMR